MTIKGNLPFSSSSPTEKAPDNIRFSAQLHGSVDELLQVAHQFQLEGLIAKRPDSIYESGRRSDAWVKVKLTQEQEFVVGGYTRPEGSRKYFGSLFIGSTNGLDCSLPAESVLDSPTSS